MTTNRKQYHYVSLKQSVRGFVLPFTILITVLILFVTTGVLALLTKQQYFSKVYRQTQAAYYAADDAVSCTITIDDTYSSSDGLGIFPSSSSSPMTYISDVLSYVNSKQGTNLTLSDITCGQSPIFTATSSFNPNFTVLPADYEYHFISPVTGLPEIEYGQTSTYNMHMDLGVDPADVTGINHLYRCAKVTVNKTASFRQIVAQGYSSCDGTNNAIERAVVNTTVIQ
jgi:Tfp pilus assembly protein PilX